MSYNVEKLRDRFDSEAGSWKRMYEQSNTSFKYYDKLYRKKYVQELLGSGKGTVLDLGCGPGAYFQDLRQMGYKVLGLDNSIGMLQKALLLAKELSDTNCIRGDAVHLPVRDSSMAGLIGVGLLEYLPEDRALLKEIFRILSPGGRAVITLRNQKCLERRMWKFLGKYKPNYFFREHFSGAFGKELNDLGFEKISFRFSHFYPIPWPLVIPLRPINNFLAHRMESLFSSRSSDLLASTAIVGFSKPFN